jgi:predicted dehydrogenase
LTRNDPEGSVKDDHEGGAPGPQEQIQETWRELPRREFIRNAAGAAAAFLIVPRHVLGGAGYVAPSDTLNVAGIGVGGVGRSNLAALSSQNLVALCDIDWDYVDARYGQIPAQVREISRRLKDDSKTAEQQELVRAQIADLRRLQEKAPLAARYTDYREMLEKQKDIDAVVIATPDHTHANIALAAMDLGKHVYLQKPLAWSVEECRRLARRAAETNVVTQMGNQGRSSDDARLVNEYIADGAIGAVTEVHAWTDRPLAYWAQGIPRPATSSVEGDSKWDMNGVMQRLGAALGSYSKPDALRWDLFLGPAPHVDYHPIYHPFNWRGWVDWGVGAIGDMGAHLIDHAWWALDLGYPTSVETRSTPYNRQSYPMATITYYDFPRKDSRPPVKLTWYDGGLLPPAPEELGDAALNLGGGVLYVGSKGKLLHDTYGTNPRLLPRSLHESTGKPRERYERIATSHEMNWIEAIRGNVSPTSPFQQGAPLTEVMLLGVAALNAGGKIEYDPDNMRITNIPDSDALLKRRYRKGWELT